jgi:hypothetical protein
MMLAVTVQGSDGAPPITEPIVLAAPALGSPTLQQSLAPNTYAAAWLDNQVTGLGGAGRLGVLRVPIPAEAAPTDTYTVQFNHVSASPNGLGVMPVQVSGGQVLLQAPVVSPWNDAIPDAWRQTYFGSVTDPRSAPDADPDADGVSNLAEFRAGTHPLQAASFLHLMPVQTLQLGPGEAPLLLLRWPTVAGKHYVVEWSDSLLGGTWTALGESVVGDGLEAETADLFVAERQRFYRVRVVE